MHYDVAVIGGGPAGCAAARQVAAAGYRVIVLEEHRQVGEPLQCAGLISPRSLELSGYNGPVLNELHAFTLHSPSGHTLSFRGTKTYAVVVDRTALDRQLAGQAARAGADIALEARVQRLQHFPDGVMLYGTSSAGKGEFNLKARLVIAADGARSGVARQLGLSPKEIVRMAAAEIRLGPGSKAREDVIEIFLGKGFAPGWFGWLFPAGSGRARIGVGAAKKGASSRRCLDELLKRYPEYFGGVEVIRYTGGSVPIGPPPRLYAERVMLLGDAAGQVKPLSGGGLYLGLNAAELCARTAITALEKDGFGEQTLAAYQRAWEEGYGNAIKSDLVLREVFLSLSEEKMDYLTRFFDNAFWRYLMANHADVDYPSALVSKILGTGLLKKSFFKLALDLGGFIGQWANFQGGDEKTVVASKHERA